MNFGIRAVLFLALGVPGVMWGAAGAEERAWILAVHPYLPTAELRQRFEPLAEHLGKVLGRSVTVRIGGNYHEHIDAIVADKVDIAFLGPVGYVHTVSRTGGKPVLARFEVNGQPHLYGVIAVRKDSTVRNLQGLRNKRFAFGDPESTMSYVVPRYLMLQAGIPQGVPARYKFVGSHKNVALAILAGDYEAGAMKKEVFDAFAPRGLKALAVTPGIPDHVFVARRNMRTGDIEQLRQALYRLKESEEGRALLRNMHPQLTALVPARDSDYDALRAMNQTIEAIPLRRQK
jgi:phosphonate transport system substrate-binding protein